jgi:hypothetical protein
MTPEASLDGPSWGPLMAAKSNRQGPKSSINSPHSQAERSDSWQGSIVVLLLMVNIESSLQACISKLPLPTFDLQIDFHLLPKSPPNCIL